MRVVIGSFTTDHGTVELPAAGGGEDLVYAGPDPEHTRAIVEGERQWRDRSGTLHNLTDAELVVCVAFWLDMGR